MVEERQQCTWFGRPARCAIVAVVALCGATIAADARAAETVRRAPAKVTGEGLVMPRSGAEKYDAAALECAPGGVLSVLLDELASNAKKSSLPVPASDGRLCAIAEALMGWNDPASPPESVKRFVAWHFGVTSPIRQIIMATIETEDVRTLADRVLQPAFDVTSRAVAPRIGLAQYRVKRDATKIVLVLQDAPVELKPLPRKVPANGTVVVEGQLLGSLENAKVLASNTAGRLAVVESKAKAFRAEAACGARPGLMFVEVRGEKNGSPVAVANFPVACGVEFPNSVAIPPSPPKGAVADPSRDARKMLDLMNKDRTDAGLTPLAWDDAVAGVARSAAEYLRDSTSGQPTKPFDVQARLKEGDVASPIVLQNPVAATSVEEAHALLATNPVDRENTLSPDATHAGVGAVAGTAPVPGSPSVLYFSALLVKELPPFDPAAVTRQLRAAIEKKRADLRQPPLKDDALLDEVAAKYAAALAESRGALSKEKADAIVAPLYKGFTTVNFLSGVKVDPMDFAEEPAIVSNAKSYGLAVAPGISPTLGRNSAFVVVVVGTRR